MPISNGIFVVGNNNNNNKPEAPRPPPPRRPDRPQAPQAIPVTVPTTIPTTTMSTTTTTTTTTAAPQVVDSRPFCPGTCITPILSFTCFSNNLINLIYASFVSNYSQLLLFQAMPK